MKNKDELISKCCKVKVEYSKNYILAALGGCEDFRCPECGEDPCEVKEAEEILNEQSSND